MTIDPNNRVQDILNKTNLNWKVRSEKLFTESGVPFEEVGLIRDDTNVGLSIRSNSYHPYQNEDLIELLERVSGKTGLQIHTGGFFGKGEKVYVQLKSNDLKLGDDRIEGYLTGINSFDGSTSLAFGPSNVTISCKNTFFASFREINTKVRHTKNMVVQIDEICKRLENVLLEEEKIFKKITRMSEVGLSEITFDHLLKEKVTKILFDIKPEVNLNDVNEVSTRTRNSITGFYVDMNGELQNKGETLWGLFSGVTKYTTHSVKGDPNENKMFGRYGKRELEIFHNLSELV